MSAFLALLALAPGPASADGTLSLDTLIYDDTDAVTVITPRLELTWPTTDDGSELAAAIEVDSVTAASVDVISQATPGFAERRYGGEVHARHRLGDWLPELGYRVSLEPDYRSHGATLGVERRLSSADTVLRGTYTVRLDTVGRIDTPFEVWSRRADTHSLDLSLTQVLGPRTVLRLVATSTLQTGYLEKPYRYVPLFDQAGLDRAGADGVTLDLDTFDAYRLPERPPEQVPDLRLRQAVSVRLLHFLPSLGAALRADYRFYLDDWGLTAHTVDLGFRRALPRGFRLELGTRTHLQGAASFWQRVYRVDAGQLPEFRSLDRELSPSFAQTGSMRLVWRGPGFTLYADVAVTWTRFLDFLLLDQRTMVASIFGVQVNL